MSRPRYSLKQAIDAGEVRNGDVLLWSATGLVSNVIARLCGGRHHHAAMVAWWQVGQAEHDCLRNAPMILETREWFGGRAITLWSAVRRRPGRIDVFRVRKDAIPTRSLDIAAHRMRLQTGRDYGWWSVLKASIYRLPVWRFFVTQSSVDKSERSTPYCSELIARCFNDAGVDLAPRRPDRLTTPPDLAESALLEHVYTIGGTK